MINIELVRARFCRTIRELTHILLFAKPCGRRRQKRDGSIKTWTDIVSEDFEHTEELAVYRAVLP